MKKTIDSNFAILHTANYPAQRSYLPKGYISLIGIGANMGDIKRTFDKVYRLFHSYRAIRAVKTSPILINPDFSNSQNPIYYNAVMLIKTSLLPFRLLAALNRIEKRFGRTRTYRNAPRPLDLDIIFFESKNIYNHQLTIPHSQWRERASVVVPMQLLQGSR